MRRPLAPLLAAGLCAGILAGCGNGGDRVPSLSGLPLVGGAHVTTEVRTCDKGANAFCALQFVVIGSGYPSSDALLRAESRLLHHRGWHHANAPVGQEVAADSPGHRLRVTYATASNELQAVDLGWVDRPRKLTVALSHALFDHRSALAMVLQFGAT